MTYATPPPGSGGNGRAPSPFIPPSEPAARPLLSLPKITIPAPPAEGWVSLALLIVMGLTFAWSIDNARWVLGRDGLTDFMPWVVTLSILWSFLAAWAGWGRWFSHGMGAVFAALILPIFVGATLVPGGSLHDMYSATANAVVQAYLDLAWRGKTLTTQYGHFALILGLIGWGTGQFASYAAFGHRRPMTAVVTLGLALLINMSITIQDQLAYLVIFSLAALLFLIRVNALHEQGDWIRRRIGDPKAVTGLYLRGGMTFVAVAVVGSLFLTASASSAPLADAWTGLDQSLINFGTQLQRYLPGGGPGTRITGADFGSNATITGRWVTDPTPALSITLPAGDDHTYYWRAVAYDHFDNTGWSMTRQSTTDVAASSDVLDQTAEDGDQAPVLREVAIHVTPLAYHGPTIVSPISPEKVDQKTKVTLVAGSYFGSLELAGGSGGYTMTAMVPQTSDDDPEGITANKLRAASTAYPAEIRSLYLVVPAGSVGPDMRTLLRTVERLAQEDNPYDLAQAAVDYMRSNENFQYSTDVTDLNCGDRSIAECFAHFKRGYCEYYATTMTMLMRMAGIPARYVKGFLPSSERDADGAETLRFSGQHAWVEVYFPGYGWNWFDPTGGGVGHVNPLPVGRPVSSAKPTPAPSRIIGDDERDPLHARQPRTDIVPTSSAGIVTPSGPALIILLVLFVFVGSSALLAWRRSRARELQPLAVYSGMTRLAGWLGFRPRPTETAFEYTEALAGVLPKLRPDLQTVANAKVEVAYGRADLPAHRIVALREAQRRMRLGVLRLAFRRRGR